MELIYIALLAAVIVIALYLMSPAMRERLFEQRQAAHAAPSRPVVLQMASRKAPARKAPQRAVSAPDPKVEPAVKETPAPKVFDSTPLFSSLLREFEAKGIVIS